MLLRDVVNNKYPTNYIHYDLTPEQIATYQGYWNYGLGKQGQYDNIALKIFDEKLKLKFQNQDISLNKFTKLLHNLVKQGGLQQAVNNTSEALPALSHKTGTVFSLQALNESINDFKKTAHHINSWLARLIALAENSEEAINSLQIDPQLKIMAKQLLPSAQQYLLNDLSLKDRKTIASQYQALISNLESFGKIDASSLRMNNPTINSPIASLLRQMHTTGGFIAEYLAEHAIGDKDIQKMLSGNGYSITYTGDKKIGDFNTATSDFMVTVNDKHGLLGVNIPDYFSMGISWKTGVQNKKWKTRLINIKSTNLGALWSAVEGSVLTTRHRNAFYNLYAGYNQIQNKGKIKSNQFQLMNNLVSQALLVAAISGDLNSDFAFLLVYNNKIFSIRDLITNSSVNARGRLTNIEFGPPGNLNQQQKNIKNAYIQGPEESNRSIKLALQRSNLLVNQINNIKLNYKFRINLTQSI